MRLWGLVLLALFRSRRGTSCNRASWKSRSRRPARYDVFWKQPPGGGAPLRLTPVFPPACKQMAEARGALEAGAWRYRTRIQCDPPLAGQTLAIEGLEGFPTDVLVRVQHAGGAVETHLLKPERPSITLGSAAAPQRSALAYLVLGIEHIALGVDHLLFVLGLLLIVRDRWMLVKTITAFTISHSIALAAATFGVVSVPAAPLNAAIALSILFLGLEIARTWRGETSFTLRHPWVVAFAVRAPARVRLRERPHGARPAARGDSARAPAIQRRRRDRAARLRRRRACARARLAGARGPLARVRVAHSRLRRRRCRHVLDVGYCQLDADAMKLFPLLLLLPARARSRTRAARGRASFPASCIRSRGPITSWR